MPCHWIKFRDKDGVEHTAHVKMAAPRRRKCAFCDCPDAKALCDYPMGNGKTCDKPCCSNCRQHIGPDRDYCKDHWTYEARKAQGELFA